VRYRERLVDSELASRLASAGAVVIEGPKACGKTATASQIAASAVMLDVDVSARRALAVDPALVLEGDRPRLLDEWQVEPGLWNHVRRAVDRSGQAGEFILTGSAAPPDDVDRHTGAGRLSFLRMRPMTLFETGYSNGVCPWLRSSKARYRAPPTPD
jgi:predicted AAA+ superfamily ATPase